MKTYFDSFWVLALQHASLALALFPHYQSLIISEIKYFSLLGFWGFGVLGFWGKRLNGEPLWG